MVVPRRTVGKSFHFAEKPKPRFTLTLTAVDLDEVSPQELLVELDNTSNSVTRQRECWPFIGMYNLVMNL